MVGTTKTEFQKFDMMFGQNKMPVLSSIFENLLWIDVFPWNHTRPTLASVKEPVFCPQSAAEKRIQNGLN